MRHLCTMTNTLNKPPPQIIKYYGSSLTYSNWGVSFTEKKNQWTLRLSRQMSSIYMLSISTQIIIYLFLWRSWKQSFLLRQTSTSKENNCEEGNVNSHYTAQGILHITAIFPLLFARVACLIP